jgi:hypothetical protein
MATTTATHSETRGWAVGLAAFAGIMMITIGAFQFFEGLAAVLKNQYYVVGSNYAFKINVNAYGWVHLIWGLIVAGTGVAVLGGRTWGRVVGVGVVSLNALVQFFYIPYYPIWAVLIIGLDIACIWALCVSGTSSESEAAYR